MRYRFVRVLTMVLALALVSGCSIFKTEEQMEYEAAVVTPTLQMPPDIIRPDSKRNLVLPGSKVGTEENVGRFVETGNLNVSARSLAKLEGVRIDGHADLYWLHIPQGAAEVYRVVREFWLSEGFEFEMDEPVIGVIKTAWMSVPAGNAQSFFSRLFEGMRAADYKYQFTTRVERVDDNLSRVFIAHREQERFLVQEQASLVDTTSQVWRFRESDPAREYEFLSRLMLFLGMSDDTVKAELARIPGLSNRAALIRGGEDSPSYLSVLQVFDQAWNRLNHQFSRLDVKVLDRRRDGLEGEMVVDADSFFKGLGSDPSDSRKTVHLEFEGLGNAAQTRIGLIDDSGSQDVSAEAVPILQGLRTLLQ